MLKIAIDAGHYKHTEERRCWKQFDPNETREWELNDRLARNIQELLQYYDAEYIRVDDPAGEKFIDTDDRAVASNRWGADIYLSLHHNASINGGAGGGVSLFWYSQAKEREAQAEALYNSVVSENGLIGNRADPVQYRALDVLRFTTAPAFLLENGFMDSQIDTPIIITEAHSKKTAKGIVNFLVDIFGLVQTKPIPDEFVEETDEGYEEWKRYMARYLAEQK